MRSGLPTILPLRLEGVSYEIKGLRLIKDISCRLSAGSRTLIVGPNGAGKSLFLRLCHGLLAPSSGRVAWEGAGDAGRDPARHQAMVFQRPVMLRRSVAANVDYALALRGLPRDERAAIVDQVLGRTGLRRKADSPARQLSGGEQQKLALARAWALAPQVLFLDEPTASLDPAATHALEEVIGQIAAAGTKIVMTSHDLAQARRLADEAMLLYRGRLLEHAPADAFFEAPAHELTRAFLNGELLWWRKGERGLVRHRDDA